MRQAEDIKRLIKKLNDKTSAQMDKRVLKDVLCAMEESRKNKSALFRPNIRRTIMKNPITKLAVAAAVFAVVGLGMLAFIGTGSTSGVVWAEVAQKVEASRGVIYRTRKIGMGDPNDDWPKAHVMHHKSPLHSRTDWCRGEQIRRTVNFDLSTKTMTWLAHDAKVYNKEPMKEETVQSVRNDQSPWLHPEDITSRIVSFEHRKVGTQTIDGVLCEGLETNDPAVCGSPPVKMFVGRLWVSVETGYPVLIEVETTAGEDGSVRTKGFVDQFEWDVEFSPSDRDISIPPGFRPLYPLEEEEMKILRQQGKRELLQVEIMMADGTLEMRVHVYKYELSDGRIIDMREGVGGEHALGMARHQEWWQVKKAGPGEDLGTYEETVEGRVFSFKREKYFLSDGTEVIFSRGTPKDGQ